MTLLTTCGSDVSQLVHIVQPANAHINLFCSLQKQFIPRNDFIISFPLKAITQVPYLTAILCLCCGVSSLFLSVRMHTHASRERERKR